METANVNNQMANVVGSIQCKVEVTAANGQQIAREELSEEKEAMCSAIVKIPEFNSNFALKHPLRILIADDSMVNMKIALWFLKKLGYKPDAAFNGIEVIDALKRRNYDVIFMDAEMPEMDGVETTIMVRQIVPIDKQPYIVAMTGNTSDEDKKNYLSSGMNDFLIKPLKIDEIVQILMSVKPLPDLLEELYSEDSEKKYEKIAI